MGAATAPASASRSPAKVQEGGEAQAVAGQKAGPDFAIVIPIFKHPVLVIEALRDTIREAGESNGRVVLVNDGCPYPQTHDACELFATSFPHLVDYIRTPNGGLSAARNRGVKYAMARYPGIQKLYFMDADNRLNPGAMRRASELLDRSGKDWVYPDIVKFGIEWAGDFSAPYSVYRHLFQNICEAGSMVHRRVFDAGVFYDESMRQGYEDWEFWLQCCAAGFLGQPCPDFGFRYRARRESMLRNSDRVGAGIVAYIHNKHKKLFSPRNVLALEHQDYPRYGVIDTSRSVLEFTSVPGQTQFKADLFEVDKLYWAYQQDLFSEHFPLFLIFLPERVQQQLIRTGMADWVFWQLEEILGDYSFAGLRLVHDPDQLSISVDEATLSDELRDLHGIAVGGDCFNACLIDADTGWIDSLRYEGGLGPRVKVITITGPFDRSIIDKVSAKTAVQSLFQTFTQIRQSEWRAEVDTKWRWKRVEGLTASSKLSLESRNSLGASAPIARRGISTRRLVTMAVPVMSYGGVEQVCLEVAKAFKAAGWDTRLVVTSETKIDRPERLNGVFDSVCFLNDVMATGWRVTGIRYYGHDIQQWAVEGRIDRLIGLLSGSDAVFNFHSFPLNEAMGWMKRQGAVTGTSLHVFDKDTYGAPQGHPYLMLAYEHAYDIVTTCSEQLLRVLSGMGVPSEKLMVLPNAPTFTPEKVVLKRRRAELRAQEKAGEQRPLRVLYIGRLDRQKGVDRLKSIVSASIQEGLNIDWRVCGSNVVEGDAGYDAESWAKLGIELEPAIYDRLILQERILWADVVILPSYWEGAPIILIEAQQLGAVPLATDVGAVAELVESGEDGVLIHSGDLASVTQAAIKQLKEWSTNRAELVRMSQNAMTRSEKLTWVANSAPLIARVAEMAQLRQPV